MASAGCFGASLMLEAQLVADCMKAMAEACSGTPVNVKCRWGIGGQDKRELYWRTGRGREGGGGWVGCKPRLIIFGL